MRRVPWPDGHEAQTPPPPVCGAGVVVDTHGAGVVVVAASAAGPVGELAMYRSRAAIWQLVRRAGAP